MEKINRTFWVEMHLVFWREQKKVSVCKVPPFSENVLLCFESGESSKMQIKSCMSQEKWILFTLRFHLSKNNNYIDAKNEEALFDSPFFCNTFSPLWNLAFNVSMKYYYVQAFLYKRCTSNKVLVTSPAQNERGRLRPFWD